MIRWTSSTCQCFGMDCSVGFNLDAYMLLQQVDRPALLFWHEKPHQHLIFPPFTTLVVADSVSPVFLDTFLYGHKFPNLQHPHSVRATLASTAKCDGSPPQVHTINRSRFRAVSWEVKQSLRLLHQENCMVFITGYNHK